MVVNYGSHHLLRRHLVQLSQASDHLQVVVTDNRVSEEESLAVERLGDLHGWTTVLLERNIGFGAGVNAAVRSVDDAVDVVVLLNPDASLDVPSLELLAAHVRSRPRELAAPLVRRPDGSTWSAGTDLVLATGEMRGWHRRPAEAAPGSYQPWLSGACLALSRDLWDDLGGFDDDYFLYWEDVDLSRRVLDLGGTLGIVAGATAIHDEGSTHRAETPTRARSAIYYYYNARNRLLFAAKHLDAESRTRWLRATPGASYRLLLQGGRRQFRHPSRTFLPVLRGLRDGRRLMRRAVSSHC